MNARDELAEIIDACIGELYDYEVGGDVIADAILAAGYRKPRIVTTLAELEALPFGSVILDPAGLSLHKNEFSGWRASNGAKEISAEMLEHEALPATVLYEPEPTP